MKRIRNILCGSFITGAFIALFSVLHAQETTTPSDFETELQALEETTPMPASQLPGVTETHGFYSAKNPDWPPSPADVLDVPVWPLGGGMYVMDDLNVNYAALAQQSRSSGLMTMDSFFSPDFSFPTNNLWLELVSVTNHVASLIIHPPSNVTNGVYDLEYCTNLTAPITWQWLLRSDPGQTNLVVSNATDAQGFYRLAPPYDLTANDSLGTDFWSAFFSMAFNTNGMLSLYISSPVGATGTVTFPGVLVNGPTLIVTNCGDTAVNGIYVLTNLTTQEQIDWEANGFDPAGANYAFGTYWVNFEESGDEWWMFEYDSGTGDCTPLYYKVGVNLNGSAADWTVFPGANPSAPTTVCAQIVFNQSFSVATGAVTNINVPLAAMMSVYDAVATNGIHITASQPVSVYGLQYSHAVSTAYTAYPTPLLGTNYCVMARAATDNSDPVSPHSQFAIVATANNTTVTITPSATANLVGSLWTAPFTLQQGQAYQINSSDYSGDVTGTRITSTKPIAVYAGANIAFVPDVNTAAGNPLVQEQLPVDQWGTQAVAMSFAGRTNGDSYRVLAASSDTVVTITGKVVTVVSEATPPWTVTATNETVTTNLMAGVPFDIIVDGPVEFQASQPIQVAQFANGATFDNISDPNNGTYYPEGDPCEILLPSTDRYLETNTVVTLPNDAITGDFDESFLNIIAAQSAITNTMLDGSIVASTNFVAIGSSGYYGARITVTSSGTHTVTSSQPVGVEVYGFGGEDAYGYFGGVVK